MTLRLLWADRALNRLPIMLLFALWIGYLWSLAWQNRGGLGWVEISAVWFGLMVYIAVTGFHVRATTFEMALPISMRRLWTYRVAIRALGCVLFLAVGAVIACYQSPHDSAIVTAVTHLAATAVLAVFALYSPEPKHHRLPINWRLVALACSVTMGAVSLSVTLVSKSIVYAAVPLGAAAVVGIAAWRSVPRTFELVPRQPQGRARTAALQDPVQRMPRPLIWNILRAIFTWEWWLVMAMVFVFGAMPGSSQFAVLVIIILPVMFLPVVRNLPALAHLPISRRLIFACGALPGLLIWCGGLAIGKLIWTAAPGVSLLATIQPGGPETLRHIHLGGNAVLAAAMGLFCGAVWLAGHLLQMERCTRPPASASAWKLHRLRKPIALALYGGVTLGALVLMMMLDDVMLASAIRRPLTYHLLLSLERLTEWLPPNPYFVATGAVTILAGAWRLVEARFERLEVPTKKQVEEI